MFYGALVAIERGLQRVCSFALSVIVSDSEAALKSIPASPKKASTELSETLLTLLPGSEIWLRAVAGHRDME